MPRALRVGVALTTDPEESRVRLERFCDAVEAALDLRVTTRGLFPYHRVVSELEAGLLDLVWLPPLLALRSTGRGLVTPLALPVRHGVSSYGAALFARADTPLRTADDLEGLRAAWVDPRSAAGYLVIRASLRSSGIDLRAAFGHDAFLGTHRAVVDAVMRGEADVGATFVYPSDDARPDAPPRSAGWGDAPVRVLHTASAIPSDMLAARADLEPGVRGALQDALVTGEWPEVVAAATAMLGAEAFVAPSREHLDALTTMLSELEEEPVSVRMREGRSSPR